MEDTLHPLRQDSPAAWAKSYHLASRAFMESVLRPYDLGLTQWYAMYLLANNGPTAQRDILRMLQVEKPTLSEVVSVLARKNLVMQSTDPSDQRQRIITLTQEGLDFWKNIPDPIDIILKISFEGFDEAELATVVRVLQTATQRLNRHMTEGPKP